MLKFAITFFFVAYNTVAVKAYKNIYTLPDLVNAGDDDYCQYLDGHSTQSTQLPPLYNVTASKKPPTTTTRRQERDLDPIVNYNKRIHQLLYGDKVDLYHKASTHPELYRKLPWIDPFLMFPSGSINRATRFNNRTSVHMPPLEQMHRGHCRLALTKDHLQTAVDAFFILLHGNLQDVLKLPSDYVLKSDVKSNITRVEPRALLIRFTTHVLHDLLSGTIPYTRCVEVTIRKSALSPQVLNLPFLWARLARTIAMMQLSREKLAATWTVVKDGRKASSVTYEELEQYRPLFKYVSARDMARLNMTDTRILSFIGTHPDLDRHHVGVIASRYIAMNPNWMEPLYMNLMNNLLCGIPIKNMRKVAQTSYLQLAQQLFYHTRACDPLQRRFYLAMMTRTQALGKSYSWSSRDVTRLGLLLSELKGAYLGSINPEAMSGITAEVMMEMQPANLKYITDMQRRHLDRRPLNILARKLKQYQDQLNASGNKPGWLPTFLTLQIIIVTQVVLYR